MSSLYQLTDEYTELVARLEEAETDEEAAKVMEELDLKSGEIAHKAEMYARIIKNKKSEIEGYRAEEKRLAQNRHAAEGAVEKLENRLLETMETLGLDTIQTSIGKWRIQSNPWSAEIVDESKVPQAYLIPQPPKVDKAGLIKAHRETGEVFEGVEFMQKAGLRFR